jgi:hypothetical protein
MRRLEPQYRRALRALSSCRDSNLPQGEVLIAETIHGSRTLLEHAVGIYRSIVWFWRKIQRSAPTSQFEDFALPAEDAVIRAAERYDPAEAPNSQPMPVIASPGLPRIGLMSERTSESSYSPSQHQRWKTNGLPRRPIGPIRFLAATPLAARPPPSRCRTTGPRSGLRTKASISTRSPIALALAICHVSRQCLCERPPLAIRGKWID